MISEIKRIKLEEIKNEEQELIQQINNIENKFRALEEQLKDYYIKRELLMGFNFQKQLSFLEKIFTRRYEYKKIKKQEKEIFKLNNEIHKIEKEILKEEEEIKEKYELFGIEKKFEEITKKKNIINKAKNIRDLGFTLIEAISFLENRGIQPILNEEDKTIFVNERNYTSKSSIICVHKTRYIPKNNMIKTTKNSNVKINDDVILNGVNYEYSYNLGRNTIHLCLNSEVTSHIMGNWEDCKYSILIPLVDIPNEKIVGASTVDTYVYGNLELSENTWILCPKNEVKLIMSENPNVHVLGYEGKNVKEYSNSVLSMLGYRYEKGYEHNWVDGVSIKQFNELMKNEGICLNTHFGSEYSYDEDFLRYVNRIIAIIKLIKDNNLIKNKKEKVNIINQANNSFKSDFDYLFDKNLKHDNVKEEMIYANGRQVEIFLKKLKEIGINLSEKYVLILNKIVFGDLKNPLNNIFSEIINECDEGEKKELVKLQNIFNSKESSIEMKKDAFATFILNVICESILNSKKKENGKTNITSNDLRKLRDNVELYLKQTEVTHNQEINEKESHSK